MKASVEPGEATGTAVLRLSGEITGANAREAGTQALGALYGVENLRVDLSEVTYLSSAGLRILVLLYRNAQDQGSKVVISGLSTRLRFVMRAAGFLDLFVETAEAS
ncbi:MAG TPA: STAS domain-containing protein [Actinocrinis sp.]|nr:STAS domain-containing protein [Actinocrinis sp.]